MCSVPNVPPPRGHEAMLQRHLDQNGSRPGLPMVSTFGFGYSLDSRLLANLAAIGGGAYAFIPDAGFVGTVFVNALANALANAHGRSGLLLEASGGAAWLGGHVARPNGGEARPLGPLVRGQSRDAVVRALLPPGAALRATVLDTAGTVIASAEAVEAIALGSSAAQACELQLFRLRLAGPPPDTLKAKDVTRESRKEAELISDFPCLVR